MLKFDWNILFTLINLIVFYLLMKKFLFGRIKKVMDERRELIAKQLSEADEKNEAADSRLEEYEEKLAGAESEGRDIISQAKSEAKIEYDKIIGRAESDVDKMKADARLQIEAERANALRESKQEIAALAIQTAEKVIGANVNAQTDSAMLDEFLNEGSEG